LSSTVANIATRIALRGRRRLRVGADRHVTGKIAQVSSEKPLQPTREKVGIINGFGCFPDKMSPAKNTGAFIPDDFEHEIGTNFLVKGKGLVILTSCSHRGIINTIRQAQAVSGIKNVML
jgi:7,8-dihydropterin-6-yl-methyl-4-(beta-D-ribofuranosyl)aminobenzene 5'-phosphate synthase